MKTIDLAHQVWAADLAHLDASMRVWGSGLDLDPDHPDMRMAVGLDEFLAGATDALGQRAGHWATFQLDQLVDDLGGQPSPEVAEQIHAAAVLRVLNSDIYIRDAEDIQPGTELPAVGVWAEED